MVETSKNPEKTELISKHEEESKENNKAVVKPRQEKVTNELINGQVRYYEWTEEMTEQAQNLLNEEGNPKHSEMSYKRFEIDARRNWDIFYKQN